MKIEIPKEPVPITILNGKFGDWNKFMRLAAANPWGAAEEYTLRTISSAVNRHLSLNQASIVLGKMLSDLNKKMSRALLAELVTNVFNCVLLGVGLNTYRKYHAPSSQILELARNTDPGHLSVVDSASLPFPFTVISFPAPELVMDTNIALCAIYDFGVEGGIEKHSEICLEVYKIVGEGLTSMFGGDKLITPELITAQGEGRNILFFGWNKGLGLVSPAICVAKLDLDGVRTLNEVWDKTPKYDRKGYSGFALDNSPDRDTEAYDLQTLDAVKLVTSYLSLWRTDEVSQTSNSYKVRTPEVGKDLTLHELRPVWTGKEKLMDILQRCRERTSGGHQGRHWRSMHWKLQPFGPGSSLRKSIRIEAYQAGGKPVEATT